MEKLEILGWTDPNDIRPMCQKPFNAEGKTIATNGHMAVCVSLDDQYEEIELREGEANVIFKADNFSGEFSELDYQIPIPEKTTCPSCDGDGVTKQIKCKECRGSGEVCLENEYNDYYCCCKSCEGTGIEQDTDDCLDCDKTGKVHNFDVSIFIEGIAINPKFYELLINLDKNLVVAPTPQNQLLFKNDRCSGIIMGKNLD